MLLVVVCCCLCLFVFACARLSVNCFVVACCMLFGLLVCCCSFASLSACGLLVDGLLLFLFFPLFVDCGSLCLVVVCLLCVVC